MVGSETRNEVFVSGEPSPVRGRVNRNCFHNPVTEAAPFNGRGVKSVQSRYILIACPAGTVYTVASLIGSLARLEPGRFLVAAVDAILTRGLKQRDRSPGVSLPNSGSSLEAILSFRRIISG